MMMKINNRTGSIACIGDGVGDGVGAGVGAGVGVGVGTGDGDGISVVVIG